MGEKVQRAISSIILAWLFAVQTVMSSNEFELFEYLLNSSRYNPLVRPRVNESEHVTVEVTWTTGFIIDLEEKEGLFTQSAVVQADWRDDFLTWNSSAYGYITSVVVPGKYIWTPRMTVANRGNLPFLKVGFSDDLVRVYSDGHVSAFHSGSVDVVCSIDGQKFPFDSQTCGVILQIVSYGDREVKLIFSPLAVSQSVYQEGLGHPVWEIKGARTEIQSLIARQVGFIYFHLKRKSLYYSCTMIAPSALLSILTLSAFAISNDSGEKVSCGLAIFLSFLVFLIQIGDVVPENSNGVSIIITHYMLCMIGSAIFVLHSIMQAFHTKHGWWKACKRRVCPKQERKEEMTSHKDVPREKTDKNEGEERTKNTGCVQKKCSMIVFTDAVSFALCFALNLAGYSMLLDGYMDSV